jgi:hypothetical protein
MDELLKRWLDDVTPENALSLFSNPEYQPEDGNWFGLMNRLDTLVARAAFVVALIESISVDPDDGERAVRAGLAAGYRAAVSSGALSSHAPLSLYPAFKPNVVKVARPQPTGGNGAATRKVEQATLDIALPSPVESEEVYIWSSSTLPTWGYVVTETTINGRRPMRRVEPAVPLPHAPRMRELIDLLCTWYGKPEGTVILVGTEIPIGWRFVHSMAEGQERVVTEVILLSPDRKLPVDISTISKGAGRSKRNLIERDWES